MTHFEKDQIIDYYDTCEINYRRWWDLDKSLAMHAGYWDHTTHSLREALMRENEILATMAQVKSSDFVLDAGCGVGGSSIYLSQNIGCTVTGITLSEKQVETATKKVAELRLANPPKFLQMDYTKTTFPDKSFDIVWAIESVCHASDKRDFIKEAWRLLKPGGKLIVADGFHVKNEYNDAEKKILEKVVHGWAVDKMESIPNFEKFLVEQGFQIAEKKDATKNVLPSSKRLFLYSFPAIAFSKIGEYCRWSTAAQTRDFVSYHYQFWAIKKELCRYMIYLSKKVIP
jgi:tocopherol O-methyltransferase